MPNVKVFWDPLGLEVDALGSKGINNTSDGDTVSLQSVSVRMLSIDAPELHYPSGKKPSSQDADLHQLGQWIQAGQSPIEEPALAQYLIPKLVTGQAGTLQEQQGSSALQCFQNLQNQYLKKLDGTMRPVFVWAADEHFDQYGRLLAYLAPYYTKAELAALPAGARKTFNLLLIEAGWAAFFPIYPSLPKYRDLDAAFTAARQAQTGANPLGIWQNPLTLLGYEFRMCVKLHEVTKDLVAGKSLSTAERYAWIERYCADITTGQVFEPQSYIRVPAYARAFIWPKDVAAAVGKMNLVAG